MKDLPEKWSVERIKRDGAWDIAKVVGPAGEVVEVTPATHPVLWVFLLACADKAKAE